MEYTYAMTAINDMLIISRFKYFGDIDGDTEF